MPWNSLSWWDPHPPISDLRQHMLITRNAPGWLGKPRLFYFPSSWLSINVIQTVTVFARIPSPTSSTVFHRTSLKNPKFPPALQLPNPKLQPMLLERLFSSKSCITLSLSPFPCKMKGGNGFSPIFHYCCWEECAKSNTSDKNRLKCGRVAGTHLLFFTFMNISNSFHITLLSREHTMSPCGRKEFLFLFPPIFYIQIPTW